MKMKAMGALMHMGRILHILFRFGCFYDPYCIFEYKTGKKILEQVFTKLPNSTFGIF